MDYAAQIQTHLLRGNSCTEALLLFALELKGEENADLVQAAFGLARGMHCQNVCGALTAGAMMLSLFDRQTAAQEWIPDLVEWFDETWGMEYGSINCEDIAGPQFRKKAERCTNLVIAVGCQCAKMLEDYGVLPNKEET